MENEIDISRYKEIFENIKQEVLKSQYKAMQAVNTEMIYMYWNIGKIISANIKWGNKFVDSLSIVNIIDMNSECTVVDVGTGGGFPGIPLKIAFPTIKLTMIDSLDKRITFLNNVIKELSLFNTCAIHTRAEEYGHTKARDSFDICVTRAVSNLSVISEYCLPLVKPGGCFIPYKSGAIKEEIDKYEIAVEELGGVIDDVAIFELPDSDIMRSLCLIYKDGDTPKKYPRKNGIPLKRPLM